MDSRGALIAAGLLGLGFLCGSIPCGFLIARARGVDIRKHGSGNIGATNVGRVLGKRFGFLCFFLDFLKGLIPSVLAGLVIRGHIANPLAAELSTDAASALWLGVAVCAVLGHMFTPWLAFRGGKGVACGFGAMLGVFPVFTVGALVAIVVWVIALKLTRMVSIASLIACGALALVVVASHFAPAGVDDALGGPGGWYRRATGVEAGFVMALWLLIIFKHRGNIARTIKGTEPRIKW